MISLNLKLLLVLGNKGKVFVCVCGIAGGWGGQSKVSLQNENFDAYAEQEQ